MYTIENIKKDLNYFSKKYNFKYNFFENNEMILIENNLEVWFIKFSKQHCTLLHTNKESVLSGKICSYHPQKQRERSKKALLYFFHYIDIHGKNKIFKKTRMERIFERIS